MQHFASNWKFVTYCMIRIRYGEAASSLFRCSGCVDFTRSRRQEVHYLKQRLYTSSFARNMHGARNMALCTRTFKLPQGNIARNMGLEIFQAYMKQSNGKLITNTVDVLTFC
jgi:hypothetical protein